MAHPSTYLFAGGGTGGHLYPGIAVAEEIGRRDRRARFVFAGSEREIERKIVRRHGFEHEPLPVEPSTTLRGHPVRFLWRNWQARRRASSLLERYAPEAVIGLGGFASAPVVLAAAGRRTPVLLLEQNIVPGRATRWLSPRASLVCLAFDESEAKLPPHSPTCVTGNPVRRQIAELHSSTTPHKQNGPPALLVLGGSQGAAAVNRMVLCAVEQLRPQLSGWTIMHQTGPAEHADVARRYAELNLPAETAPFFDDMADRYARAVLAVTRAGATSLAELACAGVPSIIVPYPNSLGDHQRLAARFYQQQGAARVVEQHSHPNTAAQAMCRALSELTERPDLRRRMRRAMHGLGKPDAACHVVDRLYALAGDDRTSNRRSA